MRFTKMHGLGNDYLYVNAFDERIADAPALARAMAHRHTGVGSDGLILVGPSAVADVRMEMYNADGSRGRLCGNGLRCVAKYAYEHGLLPPAAIGERLQSTAFQPLVKYLAAAQARCVAAMIETDSGVLRAAMQADGRTVQRVCADMGRPMTAPSAIPTTLPGQSVVDHPIDVAGHTWNLTCVAVGSAHAVIFVDDIEAIDLLTLGPALENAPVFPDRINVHLARVRSKHVLEARHWERGSGPTQACGTGACSVCVAGVLTGRTDRAVTVQMPGGAVDVTWDRDDHLYQTGPAVEVFTGEWPAAEVR